MAVAHLLGASLRAELSFFAALNEESFILASIVCTIEKCAMFSQNNIQHLATHYLPKVSEH